MLFSVIRSLFSGGSVDFMSILMQIVAVLFVIFCILPLHEFAHGWVAYKLGDNTAKYQGRLTFNPIASVDPLGRCSCCCLALVGQSRCRSIPTILRIPRGGWPSQRWRDPYPTCWPL